MELKVVEPEAHDWLDLILAGIRGMLFGIGRAERNELQPQGLGRLHLRTRPSLSKPDHRPAHLRYRIMFPTMTFKIRSIHPQ